MPRNTVVGVNCESLTNVAQEKYKLDVVPHDLNKLLPFEDGQFDVVVAISILDYLLATMATDLAFKAVKRSQELLGCVLSDSVGVAEFPAFFRAVDVAGHIKHGFQPVMRL
jgi:hypothetical protein